MNTNTCAECDGPMGHRYSHAIYCSSACRIKADWHAKHPRTTRQCPGCAVDITDLHANNIYCSQACRSWVRDGHTELRSAAFAASCAQCHGSMKGKRANAVYCTRKCKATAAQKRRPPEPPGRYRREIDRRKAYAIEYGQRKPHVGQAARAKRKQRIKDAGGPGVSSRDWLRLCNAHDRRCYYCRERKPLTMDHVVPLSRGGKHSIGNILPACLPCNSSKRTRFLSELRKIGWTTAA